MVRRPRLDIFFVLYLSAIAAFVVVSRERELFDNRIERRSEAILATFLPPVPVLFERDTIYHSVDADDSSGAIALASRRFSTDIIVQDIGSEDTAFVTLNSMTYGNALISSKKVEIGGRIGVGELRDRTVRFPLTCEFERTGMYRLVFDVHAARIHAGADGTLRYRSISFDPSLVTQRMIDTVEHVRRTLTVIVEDTSVSTTRAWARTKVAVAQPVIASVIGRTEHNIITVSHLLFEPDVRIVRGAGTLRRMDNTLPARYEWTSTMTEPADSVVIEARIRRSGYAIEAVYASFTVRASQPFLDAPLPGTAYAGEDLACDIRVAGLHEDGKYHWVLRDMISRISGIVVDSGRGGTVRFHVPSNYVDRTLQIRAAYDGAGYPCIDPISLQKGASVFTVNVVDPPTQIDLMVPPRPLATQAFLFTASQYNDPKYRNDRPIGSVKDIHVTVETANDHYDTDITMITPGRFQFTIQNSDVIANGTFARITIRAREAEHRVSLVLYRN